MHIPIYQTSDDTDWAVIFIHGFMGTPNQFTDLADAVHGIGCTYRSVLLPGHGGGIGDFIKPGLHDWQAHVQKEIDEIKHDYKKIFLIGHSMGGLLALNASLIKENKISGVVLLSTPLKVYLLNPKRLLLKLRLLRLPKDDQIKAAYIESNSITASRSFFYSFAIKPAFHFYRLVQQTKKRLPEVFVPVCMFHSKNDETTSYQSAALLYDGLRNTQRTAFSLEKSWHVFYEEAEREMIKDKVIRFMQQN